MVEVLLNAECNFRAYSDEGIFHKSALYHKKKSQKRLGRAFKKFLNGRPPATPLRLEKNGTKD